MLKNKHMFLDIGIQGSFTSVDFKNKDSLNFSTFEDYADKKQQLLNKIGNFCEKNPSILLSYPFSTDTPLKI